MSQIDRATRFRVLEAAGFTCQYCGRRAPAVALEVDHVQPRARGGSHDPVNLVAACTDCNRGKRDRVLLVPPFVTVLASAFPARSRRPAVDSSAPASLDELRAVRARSDELIIVGYCENQNCASRTTEFYVKDLDRTFLAMIERRDGLRCGVCGRTVVVKRASTLREHEAQEALARDLWATYEVPA